MLCIKLHLQTCRFIKIFNDVRNQAKLTCSLTFFKFYQILGNSPLHMDLFGYGMLLFNGVCLCV